MLLCPLRTLIRLTLCAAFSAIAIAISMFPGDVCAQSSSRTDGASLIRSKEEARKKSIVGLSLAATGEDVVELRIVGNKTIATSQILNKLQTRSGRPFDPKIVQRDVRTLASLSWFVDVKPLYERTPEGRIVIFQVVERPTVRYVEFLGNRRIRDKTLTKEIGIKIGGSVDPYAVEDGRRKLLGLYTRNGFNKTQITILEGNKATDQGVVYVINEGIAQRIWDVKFEGVNFVTPRRLKTRVKSKHPTMMVFKGYVDRDQIENDVRGITDFYRAFGFYQAKVGRRIDFNEKGTWATLTFVVHEGPRYQVRNVKFMGNRLINSGSLATGLRMPASEPFERTKMNNDIAWLQELYGSQGYVFADIRAEQVLLEEPGQLDLVYHIEEGKRWRVGRIIVNINGEHTHSRIQTALNRLSLQPGEVVDIREVRASERRLQASGLFLTDAIQGVSPKITFQIPEIETVASTGPNIRGQSPDPQPEPNVEPIRTAAQPSVYGPPSSLGVQSYQVRRPAAPNDTALERTVLESAGENTELVDIYLEIENETVSSPDTTPVETQAEDTIIIRGQSPGGWSTPSQPIQPSARRPRYGQRKQESYPVQQQARQQPAPVQLQTVRPAAYSAPSYAYAQPVYRPPTTSPTTSPTAAYNTLAVRSQSPYQPAPQKTPPPANQQGYGGQLPAATSPQSSPIRTGSTGVQPVQYVESLPPPGGPAVTGQPVFAPPPQVLPQQGLVQQGFAQQNITPLPPQPGVTPLVPFSGIDPYGDPAVNVIVDVAEAPTGRFQIGAGINSDAGVVGTISLDERNFDWRRPPTSFNDFANGRAWRGDGQRFRLEAAPGTQVQRYLASFSEPYLWDTPVSFSLSGSFFERRFRDWDEKRLGGRAGIGYQWIEHDLSATLGYRGESVTIDNITPSALVPATGVPGLISMNGDNFLHGFRVGFANDTRDSAFFPTEGHLVDLSLEQVVGSFDYARAILDIREYGLLFERPDHSGRHVISTRSRLGFTGSNTPVYDKFFAGGFSTMRGFDFRGASPVFEFGAGQTAEIGGNFMWINSIEYLFPLTADDMMHGVVFVDFGTVEENVTIKAENFRVSPGLGLRVTVPAMGPAPIALDFAWGVVRDKNDDLQVFSFNVGFAR